MFPVAESLALFERGADPVFHFIKEGGAEGVTKESIVEVADITPEAIVTVTTFRNEAMDVGVPFQISAKGMKDHDKTGSKIQGFILFEKHAGNNTVDSVEEAVEQCPVIKEEPAEVFVNGKDTMPVDNVYQLEGHGGGTLHGVEVSAGRAEAAVAPEGDKFQFTAFGAAEHCPAKGGIATVDHFIDIFHHSFSWVESIYNFFIMVCKNSLKDIHKTIMKENSTKRNP